jgi:serine/threonine-protein kinase HipA
VSERGIEVAVQIGDEDVLAGRLWAHRRGATESATFAYDPTYLADPRAYSLEPALPLSAGQQQTAVGRAMFGAFSDSAPDRWGRRLITREERRRAQAEGATERSFAEIDYLLGARDDLRQGALRFRDPSSSEYLATEHSGAPHLINLPVLLGAAERLERDEAGEEELRTLLRGGSSLGGARPKAHVLDQNGRIAIAKFPNAAGDEWDVIRWEAVALKLAAAAGVAVSLSRLQVIDGKGVLIVDRFDRAGERRVGYASAMTMLEARDGDTGSYLEIADVIERESPQARLDLRELWRRIAFSILISNTDDHLRNHGFLRTSSAGWTLAPAFDLNPSPQPGERHLNTAIDFNDTSASLDLLRQVAGFFRIADGEAQGIIGEVARATRSWREVARAGGLGEEAIDQMGPAFEHDQAQEAGRALAGAQL